MRRLLSNKSYDVRSDRLVRRLAAGCVAAGLSLAAGGANAVDASQAPVDLLVRVEAVKGALHFSYQPMADGKPVGETPDCHVVETLILPVGKTARIVTTSTDVAYTWRIALLGLSLDLAPGAENETVVPAAAKTGIGKGRLTDAASGVETVSVVRVVGDAVDASGQIDPQTFCMK